MSKQLDRSLHKLHHAHFVLLSYAFFKFLGTPYDCQGLHMYHAWHHPAFFVRVVRQTALGDDVQQPKKNRHVRWFPQTHPTKFKSSLNDV